MDIASYVLLSQEQALRRRMDVAANNLANMSTVGFRRERPVFREYVEPTESAVAPARQTSFVLDYGAVHDAAQGAFQPTGNPLDVMIEGEGYLSVEAGDGTIAYTRAGFIKILENGELATTGGQRILGEGGQPIIVPPEETAHVSVAADGTVTGANGPLGQLTVTIFDEANVDPRGDGLMRGTGGRELATADIRLKSGGVEGSNVNAIVETTDMIEILRAYQNSQNISRTMADMRKQAIDRLSRIG